MHSCHITQVRCHGGRVSRKCRTGDIPLPRSLTRYARSFGCGERGKHAREWKLHYPQIQGRSGRRTCAQEERPGERIPALPVFHRLRPPDKHHRIGRSNQWWRNPTGLKDTRRFPLVAPSCALLFLPFGLPMSIRCYGRVYLIPRLTLGSGKAVRSKLDCMHEPPVQPDYHVVPVTIILSPTRNRHEKSPVAVAISKRIHGAE